MPQRAYLLFGDIEGKLDVLRVECAKCSRKGRYHVQRRIEVYGRKGNMSKWLSNLKGDCPKRDAHSLHERCDLVCPDLPKGRAVFSQSRKTHRGAPMNDCKRL